MFLLLLALLAPADLRLETVRESLTGAHCRERVYVDGLPTDDVVVRPCTATERSLSSRLNADVASTARSQDRWLNGRRIRRRVTYVSSLEPWAEDLDVETGTVVRRFPLFYRATKPARVFEVNPVVATNDPSLQDRNDVASAVPAHAYRDVQLEDVADSGPLRGPWAALADLQPRAVPPPDVSSALLFDREMDSFEDVNAYFHVDHSQRYVQSLGFIGSRAIAPYAIEIDAHALSGADGSVFIPSASQAGRGSLYFGEGGTDDAEDADLVVHEYGHALLEWIAPGAFAGPTQGQGRAIAEGFCDYWAYSEHADARIASGRDPFCFGDWDARCWEDEPGERCASSPGRDCLRRLDSTRTMADYESTDRAGVEHQNGTIWSSALREIREGTGRAVADTIVLEGTFDVPAQPTFATVARLMLRADQLLYGGTHSEVICAAMVRRGILTECGSDPRGEWTLFPSTDRDVPVPDLATITSSVVVEDTRAVERILVRVDLEHASRGDLRIQLIAPDGTTITLQRPTNDRGRDLHTTYGLIATPVESLDVLRGMNPAGVWQLRISDERARDAGTLLSWGLLLQLAGDERAATRPRAPRSQMIPVVTHVYGANDTAFRSDLRLANVTSESVRATLVFTPSGSDGTTAFASVNVLLAPGQTFAADDVVESAFGMTGSGSLEILGDVVAMSRIVSGWRGGTVGQQVPPSSESSARGPLLVASIDDSNTRVNLGITEVAGSSGEVLAGGRRLSIAPFSHLQFRVPRGMYAISSTTPVVAYLSQVDDTTGDAMFIPAQGAEARGGVAPAITRAGADRIWRSDLWVGGESGSTELSLRATEDGHRETRTLQLPAGVTTYADVLGSLFQRTVTLASLEVPIERRVFAATRVATDGVSEFIPFVDGQGPVTQQLLFIDTISPFRTNVGIVAPAGALAEVVVVDAAGRETTRTFLFTDGGVAQTSIVLPVSNGRATVRFLSGTGRAYASLVDARTGDATFVQGQ